MPGIQTKVPNFEDATAKEAWMLKQVQHDEK
jgi:hypothetical protein